MMLIVGEKVVTNGIVLVPISAVQCYSRLSGPGGWWYGSIEPFAVVVSVSDTLVTFELGRGQVPLAGLVKQVPELESIIRQL